MNARHLLTAIAVATLAACGGGGGGGGGGDGGGIGFIPPPPPPPPPPPENSSAACFNEADLREGTTVELEQDIVNGSNTVKLRTVTITRARESFRDVNPVRRLRTQYYGTGGGATDRQYMDYIDGKIVRYGVRNGGEDAGSLDYAYNDPPVVTPTMSPGQTVDMNYTVKSVEGPNGEIRNQQVITGTDTYVGRESLETPMGAINACKFSGVVRFRQVDGSDRTEYQDNWIAAEGPYRGQLLRFAARTGDTTTNFVTTKITYTPR